MTEAFLDTNVLLRHLLADDPQQSPRATAVLKQVERGERVVYLADLVILETIFVLERTHKKSKPEIAGALRPLIDLPGTKLPNKRLVRRAFDLYTGLNLPFADAYYAALMEHQGWTEIIGFDRHFERIPGITRIEP